MPIPLRTDFTADALRVIARKSKDGPQARRLLALAAIYEGATRTEAARIGGVTRQIVRDWVVKLNAHGPEGLIDRKPPGQPSKLDDTHRAALAARIDAGPIPSVHGVVRWRLVDLIAWLWEEFRITISKQTLSRELRAMEYRKLSARPRHHAKDEAAVAAFKKTFPPAWTRSRRRRLAASREIWFCDEARVGQKNKITRRWAKRGTRPAAPKDQRTASAYIFGAICPAEGKGAGLVLPRCTTEGMTLHLNEIAQAVAPGAHALVLLASFSWTRPAGIGRSGS
jgi:transposase